MNRTAREIQTQLEDFQPGPSEAHSVSRLYEILDGVSALPDRSDLVPALFDVLERYPDADFGSPGPIVHALESIAPFSKELAMSLMRQPTRSTVDMVGRILNSNISAPDRAFWSAQLESVRRNPRCGAAEGARVDEILGQHAA